MVGCNEGFANEQSNVALVGPAYGAMHVEGLSGNQESRIGSSGLCPSLRTSKRSSSSTFAIFDKFQRPLNSGFRFSRKAVSASFVSSVSANAAVWLCS